MTKSPNLLFVSRRTARERIVMRSRHLPRALARLRHRLLRQLQPHGFLWLLYGHLQSTQPTERPIAAGDTIFNQLAQQREDADIDRAVIVFPVGEVDRAAKPTWPVH